jgi:putative redox protein
MKQAKVTWSGAGLRFEAESGSGHRLVIDDVHGDAGPRPIELLLVAQAGCTAMDVASILAKKRQIVTRYEVRVSAEQRDEHPKVMRRIDVVHDLEGPDLDLAAVSRAIELSASRYCTVGAMLASGVAEVVHRYTVRRTGDESGDAESAVVARMGPGRDVDARVEAPLTGPAASR